MGSNTVSVNDASFKAEVLDSPLPVLVDFFAAWCGPCGMLAPVIEAVAAAYEGRLKVCKVDIDGAAQSAAAHGVMSIPTLVLFKAGKEVDRLVGSVPRAAIEKMVNARL
ncbi:MAG: thioredoxin [Candidatus Aureabacteria bacterium]|nr:thioredoxin [Candidatus Auribacterota bacterium]